MEFTLSVCPSVSGWYAVLKRGSTPSCRKKECQNSDLNCAPLLDIICSGSPWCLYDKECRNIVLFLMFWNIQKGKEQNRNIKEQNKNKKMPVPALSTVASINSGVPGDHYTIDLKKTTKISYFIVAKQAQNRSFVFLFLFLVF